MSRIIACKFWFCQLEVCSSNKKYTTELQRLPCSDCHCHHWSFLLESRISCPEELLCKKKMFLKFLKTGKDLESTTLLKMRLHQRSFHKSFAKIFKNIYFVEHLGKVASSEILISAKVETTSWPSQKSSVQI